MPDRLLLLPVRLRLPSCAIRILICAMLVGASAVAAAQNQAVDSDGISKRVAPCLSCHGKEGRAARDGYYPRIAGKPAGYLYNQLLNFREGRRRQYPLMVYMVQHLSDTYLQEMANYFSSLQAPYPPSPALSVPNETLEKGRALTTSGDASRKIPACVSCHGEALTGVAPFIPGLLGIPRDYINAQFGSWRSGTRQAVPPDCMGQIAKQLSPEDISAVSAWLATRPLPPNPAPAQFLPAKLPVACGSVPQSR